MLLKDCSLPMSNESSEVNIYLLMIVNRKDRWKRRGVGGGIEEEILKSKDM